MANDMVQEHRGKIGMVGLKFNSAIPYEEIEKLLLAEFREKLPEDIIMVAEPVPLEEVTPEGLIKMGGYVEEAAVRLVQEKPDVIVFGCTSGSFIKGIGYDKAIIRRIEDRTGIPATTATTAVVDSLSSLKVERVFVATPYSDEVNQIEKSFLESTGFEITAIKGLGLEDPAEMPRVPPDLIYSLVKEGFTENAEAIFISCAGLIIMDIIEALEEELKRPVVTSRQAILWSALGKMNMRKSIKGLGKLFSM